MGGGFVVISGFNRSARVGQARFNGQLNVNVPPLDPAF